MNDKIIADITNFIFVEDEPQKVDAIFLPGGSHLEQPEYAVELYHKGYAKWLIPLGGVSIKRDKWQMFAQRQIYTMATINPTASSLQMFLLKMECLLM